MDTKFKQIVIIDDCGLTSPELEELAKRSENPLIIYNDQPANDSEILTRVGKADAVLVSWKTQLRAEVVSQLDSVIYIGMCCSLYDEKSANVNIGAARTQNIVVKGVRDYGDEGTVEFVFAQLISLFKGFGNYQWRETLQELKGKTLGIVGMGTLGKMVADTAIHFGMEVKYFSRTHKPELPYTYRPLDSLMQECDVITTHLPKHSCILTKEMFSLKKKNSILINTSLGSTYEKESLLQWLKEDPTSFAIFDSEGSGLYLAEFKKTQNIIVYPKSSGSTIEAKKRLSQKVIDNIDSYLASRETNLQ